jgi:putative Mg2+ transporter-C (MgtC) family protein
VSDESVMLLRLLLALALGSIIGWERERDGKEAGLRTHMLICVGAALFTIVSFYGFSSPLIAAGVVTGVGFLGAGAIMKADGGSIKGLTTAASVWISAAIGLACGIGLYLVASFSTIIALIILLIHPRICRYMDSRKCKK